MGFEGVEKMNNQFIVPGPDGKPVFLGREDPQNPPVKPTEGTKMECPFCRGKFDYLVGEDTPDGGRMGCESCWKPPQSPIKREGVEQDVQEESGEGTDPKKTIFE